MKYGKFDVYLDDKIVGSVDIMGDGLLTCFVCRAEYDTDEILRLAADVGDAYEPVGVMMPDVDGFSLKKYLTKNDIYLKKLDNAEKYVLISQNTQYKSRPEENLPEKEKAKDERLWTVCENPADYFSDKEAGEAIAMCRGVLKAEHEGAVYIAVPVNSEEPFPALPIFYFGQRGMLEGKEYLLFTLRGGMLQI